MTSTRNGLLDQYIRQISQYPLLSRSEERRVAEHARRDGDVAATQRLVLANLRFVVKIAHQYQRFGFDPLDLIQEGNMGLIVAAEKFDPTRGYRLLSYAIWWIRALIRSYVIRSWSLVKIGTTPTERRLFFAVRSRLATHCAIGESGAADLARVLGVSAEQVSLMELRIAARDFSLDHPRNDAGAHWEGLADPRAESPEDQVARAEHAQQVRQTFGLFVSRMDDRTRAIMRARLRNDKPLTLREVSQRWGTSSERIRQIQQQTLRQLRKSFRKQGLALTPA